MAGTTGLEPAASAVTGQRSNQLNYVPTCQINEMHNRQYLSALHGLHISPNVLRAPLIVSNREETANKKLNKLSSQNYPSSFSRNTKGREPRNRLLRLIAASRLGELANTLARGLVFLSAGVF